MAIVIALLIGVLASIIVAEMYQVMPVLTDWLLRIATRRLAGPVKDRCFEEWRAQLADIPSPLLRLIHAASLLFRAETILREDINDYFRTFDASVEMFMAATKKARAETGVKVAHARGVFAVARVRFAIIRMVVIIAMFQARKSATSEKFGGVRGFLANYASRRQKLLQFQKSIMDCYQLIKEREDKAIAVIREVRAERAKAVAALARCEDYDTRSPAVVVGLCRKLTAEMNNARLTKSAKEQAMQNIKEAHAAMQNGRSLSDVVANNS